MPISRHPATTADSIADPDRSRRHARAGVTPIVDARAS
jgi:hypothetical protein